MIVWVADKSGTSLYPMFTHGYPAAVLVRLGTISTDANNATAAAWRSGELVAVPSEADSPGALVTPIITADGCVGVLAAELRNGRERREDVRALATIFSAQLATVVTPVAEVSEAGLVDRVAHLANSERADALPFPRQLGRRILLECGLGRLRLLVARVVDPSVAPSSTDCTASINSAGSATALPLTAVTTSPAFSPARAAGESASTLLISTPFDVPKYSPS